MTERNFGRVDGLGLRLAHWANQLSRDKKYPWVGTGIIDDLKCAARQHGADPDALYPAVVASPAPPPGPAILPPPLVPPAPPAPPAAFDL